MRITEALSAYALQLTADGRSPHTLAQAIRHVRMLITAAGDRHVARVRPEDLARFLADAAATRRPSSANALRSSLRCFFGYVHAAGLAPTNAARLVRRSRVPPARPRAVAGAEIEKLLAALERAKTPAELRDRALVHLLLRAGLRVGSAVALDVEDLDLAAGEVRLRSMKNGDQDVAYLPAATAELLSGFVEARSSGPVFVTCGGTRIGARQVHRRLAMWSERAGIGHVHPHRLRHTFGLAVYERTGDVLVTARALCHRSVSSTATYARPSAARVRAAVGWAGGAAASA